MLLNIAFLGPCITCIDTNQPTNFLDHDFYILFDCRPSHTSLKARDRGQNDPTDLLFRDFKSEVRLCL